MPELYSEVKRDFSRARASTLNGVGVLPLPAGLSVIDPIAVSTQEPATRTFTQTITDIANVFAQGYLTREQAKAQQKILDTQLQLAREGKPPLDIDPSRYGVPGPSVGVGLTEDTKRLLMYGAGFAALLFIGSQVMRRR